MRRVWSSCHLRVCVSLLLAACSGSYDRPTANDAPAVAAKPRKPAAMPTEPSVTRAEPEPARMPAAEVPRLGPSRAAEMAKRRMSQARPPEPAAARAPMPEAPPAEPKQAAPVPPDAPADPPDAPAEDWAAECDYTKVFGAHGGDQPAFRVPAGAEFLTRFYFDAPWPADVQLIKSRATIDPRAVHHWALYSVDNLNLRDRQILKNTGALDGLWFENSVLTVVGGPGASSSEMPDDVGQRLLAGEGRGYVFEAHYWNVVNDEAVDDQSSIELCVTTKPRRYESAIHYTGRVDFSLPAHATTEIRSTCSPKQQTEPVHLMGVAPHMHNYAVHAKLVLRRSSGEALTLLDDAFATKEQRTYPLPRDGSAPDVVMMPGDTLETTCRFENTTDRPIEAGSLGAQEMCVMVLWAWPTGVLFNEYDHGEMFGLPEDSDCLEP